MEFTGDWRWHGTVSTKIYTIAWKGAFTNECRHGGTIRYE